MKASGPGFTSPLEGRTTDSGACQHVIWDGHSVRVVGVGTKNFRLKSLLEFNLELQKSSGHCVTPEFTISGNGAWRHTCPESTYFIFIDDFVISGLRERLGEFFTSYLKDKSTLAVCSYSPEVRFHIHSGVCETAPGPETELRRRACRMSPPR